MDYKSFVKHITLTVTRFAVAQFRQISFAAYPYARSREHVHTSCRFIDVHMYRDKVA